MRICIPVRQFTFLLLFAGALTAPLSAAAPSDTTLQARRVAYMRVVKLKQEVSSLRRLTEEREHMLKAIERAKHTSQQLANEIRELQQQIERFRLVQNRLRCWSAADLVLGNESTGRAIAIKCSSVDRGEYEVTAVAQHPFLNYAILAAKRGRVVRKAEPEDIRLMNDLFHRVELRTNALPYVLSEMERSRLMTDRDASLRVSGSAEFVVYRDAVSDQQRVALIDKVAAETNIVTLSPAELELATRALVGGSCHIGDSEAIEPHLEAGVPFLDYCALSVLKTLFSEDNYRGAPTLAVSVILGNGLGNTVPVERSAYFDRYVTTTSTAAERGSTSITAFGREMYDELRTRLVRRKVRVVERELTALVQRERAYALGSRDLAEQSHAEASHLLVLKIDNQVNGKQRLALKLIDTVTHQAIWSATDQHVLLPSQSWENYLIQSGEPVVATFRTKSLASEFDDLSSSTDPCTRLVVQESGNRNGWVRLRPANSPRAIEISKSNVELKAVTSDGTALVDDFHSGPLSKELYRLLALHFGRHLLTPATELSNIEERNGAWSANVALGTRHGLSPGDRFRLRPMDESGFLPVTASLVDILGPRSSRVVFPACEFSATQPPNGALLAICDTWQNRSVAIFVPTVSVDNPQLLEPKNFESLKRLKSQGFTLRDSIQKDLFQAMTSLGVNAETAGLEYTVPAEWRNAFGVSTATTMAILHDRIDQSAMAAAAGRLGATHVIGGVMKRIGANEWQVSLALVELQRKGEGFAKGNSVESVTFDIYAH